MTDEKARLGRVALRQRTVGVAKQEPAASAASVEELKALSEKHGIPAIDLGQLCLDLGTLELLPSEIAERHLILPALVRDDRLFVAMANPQDKRIIDELEFVTGKKVYPYVAPQNVLSEVIQEAYSRRTRGETHYVGPRCPPEALRKAGLATNPAAGGSAPDAAPGPGGVVDSVVPRNGDLADDGFGDLSKELSAVTDLPEELLHGNLPQAPGSAPATSTKTILVVDDEEEIRVMLQRLLVGKGYRVVMAENGRVALRLVKEHTPDLIVLDAMLPEVHGFDIARRIKGSKRYGHVPIIMVSAVYRGWRFAQDLRESCGVEHYIEKPFRINTVLEAVESALAVEEEPSSSRAREISEEAEAELNAGVAAYKEGRVDDAVAHLKRGLRIDPLAYRLHFHLGLLYGKKGQIYEAIGELERAVEINSRHFPAVKNLAVLYQKAGFRNKATEMWERALNVAPDDPTRQSIKEHLLSLL